jgi:NAD(P)-dependent dehydrogenase (short-subunit alcohol dehydrogenase family)
MSSFEGQTALVTGAGSGMGRAISTRLAAGGAHVVVADLREQAARVVADEIGAAATPLAMDVGVGASVREGVARVLAERGRLDVVVNNAGMLMLGTAKELDEDGWDRAMAVNLKSVYLVAQAAWDALSAVRGAIVNVASINASVGMEGHVVYPTAKAGVVMLTKCMALDGARDGIRVNCVCPGWIETPMTDGWFDTQDDPAAARAAVAASTPLGRMGRPADIAEAVAYLASGAAEWVTGSALVADGGVTAGAWNG